MARNSITAVAFEGTYYFSGTGAGVFLCHFLKSKLSGMPPRLLNCMLISGKPKGSLNQPISQTSTHKFLGIGMRNFAGIFMSKRSL